jgi:hypothetical protein
MVGARVRVELAPIFLSTGFNAHPFVLDGRLVMNGP